MLVDQHNIMEELCVGQQDIAQDLHLRWGEGGAVDADAVAQAYDPASHFGGDVSAAFVQLDGDETVVCPAQQLAATVALHLAPGAVFSYYFHHTYGYDVSFLYGLLTPFAPCVPWNCTWASHFAEVGFVFGNVAREPMPLPFTDGEAALHAEMMERWANFARTGVPSGAAELGAAAWQPVGRSGDATQVALLSLTANSSNATSAMLDASFKNAQCALLNWGAAPV